MYGRGYFSVCIHRCASASTVTGRLASVTETVAHFSEGTRGRNFGSTSTSLITLPVKCNVRFQWKLQFTVGVHQVHAIHFSEACLCRQLNVNLHLRLSADSGKSFQICECPYISVAYLCTCMLRAGLTILPVVLWERPPSPLGPRFFYHAV